MSHPVDRAVLTKAFPHEAIKQRKASDGKALSYVAGHTVIHRLNDATPEWEFTIKNISTSVIGKDKNGEDVVLIQAHVALTLPGMGTREHIGVQSVFARSGEDLYKGAITDGLKKAATLFGVGLELYGPDYEDDDGQKASTPAPTIQRREQPQNGNGNHDPDHRAEAPEMTSWTDFWGWARANGFETKAAIERAAGGTMDGKSPQQVKTALEVAMKVKA